MDVSCHPSGIHSCYSFLEDLITSFCKLRRQNLHFASLSFTYKTEFSLTKRSSAKGLRAEVWSTGYRFEVWSPRLKASSSKEVSICKEKKNSEAEYLFLCPRRSTIVRPRTSSSMQKLLRQNQGSESSSQIQGKAEFDSNCGQNCSTPEIKFLSPRPCHLIMGADFFDVFQLSIDSGIWSRNSCALTVIYRAESF